MKWKQNNEKKNNYINKRKSHGYGGIVTSSMVLKPQIFFVNKKRRNFLNEAAAPSRVEASLHHPHLTSPVSAQFVSEMCLNKG